MKWRVVTKRHFVLSILFSLMAACSSKVPYSPLTHQEQESLQDYQLNHEFIAGCGQQNLHQINRHHCDIESSFCNIPPSSWFNYQQWLTVYKQCRITNLDL